MMTAMFVWMAISTCVTCCMVSAVALGVNGQMPAIESEPAPQGTLNLNSNVAGGDSQLAPSFAR